MKQYEIRLKNGDTVYCGYRNHEIAATMLSDISHFTYQGNPCEIVYIRPNER